MKKFLFAIIASLVMISITSCGSKSMTEEDYDIDKSLHNSNVEQGIIKSRLITESYRLATELQSNYKVKLTNLSDTTDSKKLTYRSDSLYYSICDMNQFECMRAKDSIDHVINELFN